ncbi:hypothetical protein [Streptosporangium sp. NPDC002607]
MDNSPTLGAFDTDRSRAIESFRGLAELHVETACFGHGDPLTDEASKAVRAAVARLPA